MRRGEIWTAAGGGDYTGNPRPVVVIQDDAFAELDSVMVCPFTSDPLDIPLFRVSVVPTNENGLVGPSRVMADKITTVAKSRLRQRVGVLSDQEMRRINQALIVFIGLLHVSSNRSRFEDKNMQQFKALQRPLRVL